MTGNRGPQRILAIATLCVFGAIGSANATLIGDDGVDFLFRDGFLNDIAVDPGDEEFDAFGGGLRDCTTAPTMCDAGGNPFAVTLIDLQATRIVVGLGELTSQPTFFLTFSDIDDTLLNVTSNLPAGVAVLTFTGSTIDLRQFSGFQPQDIIFDLTFAPPGPAPEPSTLLLLGAGLVGLLARRRRN